jgi:hypothetical protein
MEPKLSPANSRKKPYQPAPGKNFEIDPVPAIEAKTKGFFVRVLVTTALVAVATTGIFGLIYNKFGPLQSTWVVVGPIVGAMVNHYFGSPRKDSG